MHLGILITKKFYAGRVYLLYLSELNIVLYYILSQYLYETR